MEDLSAAGSRDPAALLLAGPAARVRDLFLQGRRVVADSRRDGFEAPRLAESARAAVARLSDV